MQIQTTAPDSAPPALATGTAIASPAPWATALRILWPFAVALATGFLLQFAIRPNIGGYAVTLMTVACINIMLAVSLTVVNGFTGQFSIGHAAFAGIGSYIGGAVLYYGTALAFGDVYAHHGGLLSWTGKPGGFPGPLLAGGDLLLFAAVLAAGLAAAAAGYLVGLPSLRLRGDYLAIVTLGFGEIARVLFTNTLDQIPVENVAATSKWQLPLHLGSALGFNGVPAYTSLFWVGFAALLTIILVMRLKRSAYGRALLSIREDEIAASAMGVSLAAYKVQAFVFAAFIAGIAGCLYTSQVGQITPTELGFQRSFDIIIMVVLGGLGSVSGAALAAILVTLLPEILRDPPSAWPWGFVVVILGIVAALALKRGKNWRGCAIVAALLILYELARTLALHYGIKLSEYRMIIYALSLILLMILRPQGILGLNEIWEVIPLPKRLRSEANP